MTRTNLADGSESQRDSDLVSALREEISEAHRLLSASRHELGQQVQLAADIHRSLLPEPVNHPRIEVDSRYLPVDTVGKGYCQVRIVDNSSCYITMCDVCGRGIGPVLLATRVSSEVKHFIMQQLSPREIVESLNAFIYDNFHKAHIALSFVAARLDLEQRTIAYCGAGHPAVLLSSPSAGKTERLVSQIGSLGTRRDVLLEQPERSRNLVSGDRLMFYTRAIIETKNPKGDVLGEKILAEFAADTLSADLFEAGDRILGQVNLFRNGPQQDDITLIVAEMK